MTPPFRGGPILVGQGCGCRKCREHVWLRHVLSLVGNASADDLVNAVIVLTSELAALPKCCGDIGCDDAVQRAVLRRQRDLVRAELVRRAER